MCAHSNDLLFESSQQRDGEVLSHVARYPVKSERWDSLLCALMKDILMVVCRHTGSGSDGVERCPSPPCRHSKLVPRRPADGQQWAALREKVMGRGPWTRSRGLISPSRRMFSTTAGSTSARPCPSLCLRAKDHLPEYCAPQEVQSSSAEDWRPPKSGDQDDDGRPGYPKRSRRPGDTS